MLDIRRLSLLVSVAKLGSISAAAAAAGCTASSASEQLSKLERELGATLLERSARSVRLTAAGAELADHGRRILTQMDTAQQAVQEVAGLSGGRLRVAAYHTGASRFVIPGIAAFTRRHPGVRVTFDEMEPETALPAVSNGDVDLALVNRYLGLQAPDMSGLDVLELGKEPFVLAAPASLAAGPGPASMRDLATAAWVSSRPAIGFQAITELAAARAGFTPNIVARADNYELILDLVAGGLGVALVPSRAAKTRPSVQYYQLAESFDLARLESLIVRASDHSQATSELRQLIVQQFRSATERGEGAPIRATPRAPMA
ncbi:LysR substrate-binding domain-containing protein [Arthrobacter sp. NPDC058130]|uniref:LysR substrate-binding domain-containing protein n=1 Tax=Arthrobacter sp. NPDC058130 TaxID=3346353 RepID=UPI0036E9C8B8